MSQFAWFISLTGGGAVLFWAGLSKRPLVNRAALIITLTLVVYFAGAGLWALAGELAGGIT